MYDAVGSEVICFVGVTTLGVELNSFQVLDWGIRGDAKSVQLNGTVIPSAIKLTGVTGAC